MRSTASRRLLAQLPCTVLADSGPVYRLPLRCLKLFSTTLSRAADKNKVDNIQTSTVYAALSSKPRASSRISHPARDQSTLVSPSIHPKASTGTGMSNLASSFSAMLDKNQNSRAANQRSLLDVSKISSDGILVSDSNARHEEPHHFHIYATRHNTHITLTRPNRDPLISVSAGNIGFRKSGRKHYDSAFQLASYVMSRMQEGGMNAQIRKLEVTLRGFGAGREAVTKALLGTEGRFLRGKVTRVTDATRLKFGGTRSKKPRRLG